MKNLVNLLLIFTLLNLGNITAWGEARSVSPGEAKALQDWGSRHQRFVGALQNPPRGSVSSDVQQLELLIRQIVERLSPGYLKRKQVVVSIYPSTVPNAFVTKVSSPRSARRKLPFFYSWYGFKPQKSVYELGITQGLIHLLKTEDELAFVISHELAHIEENHTEEAGSKDDKMKKWWDSQQHEGVADYKGIKRLVGKYNIRAALTALGRLSSSGEEKKSEYQIARDVIEAGTGTHHQSGIRITLAQAQIEYLTKTNIEATDTLQTPLKQTLTLNPRGKDKDEVSAKVRKDRNQFNDLWIKNEVLPKDSYKLLDDNFVMQLQREWRLSSKTWPSKDKRDLEHCLSMISAASLSPQAKIDKILHVFHTFTWSDSLHHDATSPIRFELVKVVAPTLYAALNSPEVDLKLTASRLKHFSSSPDDSPFFLRHTAFNLLLDHLIQVSPRGHELVIALLNQYLKTGSAYKNSAFKISTSENMGQLTGYIGIRKTKPLSIMPALIPLLDDYFSEKMDRMTDAELTRLVEGQSEDPFYLDDPKHFDEFWNDKKLKPAYVKVHRRFADTVHKSRFETLSQLASGHSTPELLAMMSRHLILQNRFPWNKNESEVLTRAVNTLISGLFNDQLTPAIAETFRFVRDVILSVNPSQLNKSQKISFLIALAATFNKDSDLEAMEQAKKTKLQLFLDQLLIGLSPADIKDILQNDKVVLTTQLDAFQSLDRKDNQALKAKYEAMAEEERKRRPQGWEADRIPFGRDIEAFFKIMQRGESFLNLLNLRADAKLGILGLLSLRPQIAAQSGLGLGDLRALILLAQNEHRRMLSDYLKSYFGFKTIHYPKQIEMPMNADRAAFLLDIFIVADNSTLDLRRWTATLDSIYSLSSKAFEIRSQYKGAISDRFAEFAKTDIAKTFDLLKTTKIKNIIFDETLIEVLLLKVKADLGFKPTLQVMTKKIEELDTALNLKKELPDIYTELKSQIAEHYRLQPHNVNKVVQPQKDEINTESTTSFSGKLRAASALSALARHMKIEEALNLIDYLMGRTTVMPPIIEKYQNDTRQPLMAYADSARRYLERAPQLERAFVVNAFFAGPNSALEKPEDLEKVLNYLVGDVKHKSIVQEMASALLRSLGEMKSIAVSYVLSQKSQRAGQKLTEAELLKAFFEAFGPGGIKLGQYLAFTGELGEYSETLAELQDAAMPISYLEVVQLLKKRLGRKWDSKCKVVQLLGSGSVNIAVKIQCDDREEVISVLRKDIETSSQEDFKRLYNFALELVKTESHLPIAQQKYGYLPGLIQVIRESVGLEFNKQNAFDMQKTAEEIYKFKSGDWTFTAVPAFAIYGNDAVRMAFASGKTAKKIRRENLELYKYLMHQILAFEFEHLFGRVKDQRSRPLVIANPDLHDGQILIDKTTQQVKILDFGQALLMTRSDLEIALNLLRVISNADSGRSLRITLERIRTQLNPEALPLSEDVIRSIESRTDSMDRFIYMLGSTRQAKWEIPLASVHWVQGVNRMIQLGNIVGLDIKTKIRTVLISHKIGVPLKIYNGLHSIIHWVKDAAKERCEALISRKAG